MLKTIIVVLALIAVITGGYAIYSLATSGVQNHAVATPDAPQQALPEVTEQPAAPQVESAQAPLETPKAEQPKTKPVAPVQSPTDEQVSKACNVPPVSVTLANGLRDNGLPKNVYVYLMRIESLGDPSAMGLKPCSAHERILVKQ